MTRESIRIRDIITDAYLCMICKQYYETFEDAADHAKNVHDWTKERLGANTRKS